MSNSPDTRVDVDNRPKLVHIVTTIPRWKKRLLILGLVVGLTGAALKIGLSTTRKAATVETTTVTPAKPAPARPQGSSGFVGSDAPAPTDPPVVTKTQVEPPPTLTERVSPFAMHAGFSLFAGLVVGVIFRAFLKIAATISALVLAGVLGISYLTGYNINMTAVKAQTSTVSAWAEDQVGKLKDVVISALPSTTAAGAGFVMGFKRR